MPAVDNISLTFARLNAEQRVAWVDSLTTSIADLVQDMGEEFDDDIVCKLLDIGRMLQTMREDLAMIDDPGNRAIISHVHDIIFAMRTCVGWKVGVSAFH